MEIQKIFSNVEEPDEMLYSVLMSEDEVALFSEYMESLYSKKESHTGRNIALGTAAGTGIAAGGVYGANKLGQALEKRSGLVHSKDWIGNAEEKVGKALQTPVQKGKELLSKAVGSKASLKAQGHLGEAAQKAEELSYLGREAAGKAAKSASKTAVRSAAVARNTVKRTVKRVLKK